MLNYSLNDPYKKITTPLKKLLQQSNSLVSKLLIQGKYYYDVTITNDEVIQDINNKYRHIDKPTDVISFAFHDATSIKTPLLGEIFINYQDAKRQTEQTYEYNMVLLFVHGLLHLLSFDHNNQMNAKKMFSLQKKIMLKLNLPK
ncbi:MAG: rRNA maturation RNase YbeY [Mycoplasmataceae bacterium]|jgi:probable rRNA maturation factor|nr:rRNA maturation RNase YbeY [Mycoplasmataceae bacterium]